MPQMPIGQAQRLLENPGYSTRMSRKRQGSLFVTRGKISASLAVVQGCVSQERVSRLIELSRQVGHEIGPTVDFT